ncbi:two-component sensor histidine kinase [Cedecea davisae]|uniref:Sensor histidine kinase EnvZ n=1 Tax=Cedecea davisae TaxID=158484 RepID=A0ABS6DFW5_9ENTR|nr:ATP-binding protein [Cedecea davisae]MBU4682082.1 two-component sensor histidine kinase [Cedecea davisae]MBU4689400.1 two-component sensor histidine kinase [Cedecea davisae]
MRLWPRSLLYRLFLIVLLGLVLANALTLSLTTAERMSSARNVMLDNLQNNVATSVAILDKLPADERPGWLERLARENYHYILGPGTPGKTPVDERSKDAINSLKEALGGSYALNFTALPGAASHVQAHLTLADGSPLTIDITPRMPPIESWLPVVIVIQLLLLALCAWLAVRQVVLPFTRFTQAVEALEPAASAPSAMPESGPVEVQHAAKAFNAMQARIQMHLKERTQILASISHDLQTPITRMKLRLEMSDEPELRDKLMQDLDNMTHLVREGIAYARSSETLEEPQQRIELRAFVDSLACDYQDVGKPVQFAAPQAALALSTRPQALRRILTNLLDNALKFGTAAELSLERQGEKQVTLTVTDNGPGIPDEELSAVLQPFYRIENSRNRDTGGTGLGLAIAAQLVGQLGGSLTLTNLPQGGLKASITLPSA